MKGELTLCTGAAAAVVALAAAGCGGGGAATTAAVPKVAPTESSYVQSMRRLGRALSQTLTAVGAANGASVAKDAGNLRVAQRALRRAARSLAAITPPERVRAEHALLLRGVREYAQELNGVIARLKKGQIRALRMIPTLKGVRDMERASNAIVAKGYEILG